MSLRLQLLAERRASHKGSVSTKRFLVQVVLVTCALVGAVATIGFIIDSSVLGVVHFIRGELLSIAPANQVVAGSPDTEHCVRFTFQNRCNRDVQITGAKTACTCFRTTSLPISVKARDQQSVDVHVTLPSHNKRERHDIIFYTDISIQPTVVASVVAYSHDND